MNKPFIKKLFLTQALLLLLAWASILQAQDTWVQLTDLTGTSRKGAIAVSIGSKGYIGTGFNGVYLKDLWEWDNSTGAWTQMSDLTGPGRAYAAAFAVGGKAYVVTGYNGGFLGDSWEYNPITNNWIAKSAFPGGPRQGATGLAITDQGIVALGFDGGYKKDVYQYDYVTDTWTAKADFTGSPRIYATAFAIAGKGYFGTGYDGIYKKDFYEYDLASDTWSQKTDLSTQRAGAVAFAIGNKGYIGLGDDGTNLKKDLYEYDPNSNLWSVKSNLPAPPREHAACFAIGSTAFVTTGSDNGVTYYNDFWMWQNNVCTLSMLANKTNIPCKGATTGAIDLTVSGGPAPYTFSWSNGSTTEDLTDLPAGGYFVTARDTNNCMLRKEIRIGEPLSAIKLGVDTTLWQIAKRGGGTATDQGEKIYTDAAGNVYIAGTFTSSATFVSTTLTSFGGQDIFVAKYNNLGNLQWIEQIGGTLDEEVGGIGADSLGNIYVTGAFRILAFFDSQMFTSNGEADLFLVKYSSSGTQQWVQTGGGFFDDLPNGLFTDRAGNCYLTGSFQGLANFQNTTILSNGGEDVFIAKYDNGGVMNWITQAGGTSPDVGTAIVKDISENIYITGTFQNTATFGTANLVSAGNTDIFMAKYDRYGVFVSAQRHGGAGEDHPYALKTDYAGNPCIAGYFTGNTNLGGQSLVSDGGKDIFVLKLNNAGTALFATRAGGTGDDVAYDLSLNDVDNWWIGGSFNGTANFSTKSLTSAGGSDIFLARVDANGVFRMASRTGGTGNDEALALSSYGMGDPHFTGYYHNSFLISGLTLTSAGSSDMLFARLHETVQAKAPVVTQVNCEGNTDGAIQLYVAGGTPPYTFAWSNGATTQNLTNIGAGTYLVTITDANLCTKDTSFVLAPQYVAPTAPVSASASRQGFCADDPGQITLTAVGGSGGIAGTLNWYTGSCGGTFIGSGTSIPIDSPEDTITYYARWENPCDTSACVPLFVDVLPMPIQPTGITANSTTLCEGNPNLQLTANGGDGELLRWYTGSCGGTLLPQSGTPLSLTAPATTTIYYARWEGTCGVSPCADITININPLPDPVTSITSNYNNICYNFAGNITLTASGGSGTEIKWSTSCHGPVIFQGNPHQLDAPNTTTKYFAWWENSCGQSLCDSIEIVVIGPPTGPPVLTVDQPSFCQGTVPTITLTATGGTGDYYKWFTGYCGSSNTVTTTLNQLTLPAPTATTTYAVRLENTCGYTLCDQKQVVVYNNPTASFGILSGSYCEDATSVVLTGSHAPAGTFTEFTGLTDNGNGTATFDPATAGPGGPYTVTYTYTDANGCSDDQSQQVVVRALPYVAYSGLSTTYCLNAGPDNDITGNKAPYGVFSGVGIVDSNNGVGTFDPSVAGVGTHDITYSYSDIYGCANDTTKQTTVVAPPTVTFAGLAPTYCLNSLPVTLTGDHAPDGFFTGNGAINIGFGQAMFDPAVAGVGGPYVITYFYTDANGCTNSYSQSVTVYGLPEPEFSGLLGSYCQNSPTSLLIGNLAPSGTFSGPGITPNTNGTAIFNPTTAGAGTHTIVYTVANANGCSDSISHTTEVLPIPNVNFTGLNLNYCANSPVALLTGNQAPFGSFTGPGISNSINGTANFTASVAGVGGPYNITYSYTGLNGCSNSIVKQATVNALPLVSFTGLPAEICVNALPVVLIGNHQPQGTFEGNGITPGGNGTATFDPATAGVGTHTIMYMFTDGSACTDTAFQDVIVNDLPQPTIVDILPEYCVNGGNDTITGSFYPLGSFTGPGIEDLGIGKAVFKPQVAGVGGPYAIVYTYEDFNGCTNDTTYEVTVNAAPSVDFSPFAAEYCIDDDPAMLVGNHPPDGNFFGANINDLGDGTAMFDPAATGPGTKTVKYVYTDANGCTSDTTKTTVVIPLPVKPITLMVDSNNYCENSVNDLTFTAIGGSGDTLKWFTGSCGGTFSGGGTPVNITAPNDTTVFYARWENQCGESDCDSITISIIPIPLPPTQLHFDTNNFCAGTINIVTLTADGGIGQQLKWYKYACGSVLAGIGQPLIVTAPMDTTWYFARWENACGISTCDSLRLNVTPQPIAPTYLAVDTNNFCTGTLTSITFSASGGLGDTLSWYAYGCGDSLVGTGNPLTIEPPDTITTYYARYSNKCDITECLSLTVNVIPTPMPPDEVLVDTNDFCAGIVGIIELSATGGVGDSLKWYKGSCNLGTYIGSGTPLLTNAPTDTLTYYAKWTNPCGESECDSIIINVKPQAAILDSITVDNNYFCESYAGVINFTAWGTFETGDSVRWYEGGCGTNQIGVGMTLAIEAPDTTTTYYALNSNQCGQSACVSLQVVVNTPQPPVYLTADTTFICGDYVDDIIFTAHGGNGDIVGWYADSCGGPQITTGITANIPPPDTTTTYYARWENVCGESECDTIRINLIEIPLPPDTMAVDTNHFCPGTVDYITLNAIGGYGDTLSGLGETIRWFRKKCGGTEIGTGPEITIPAPVVTTWYFARWENACGASVCDSFEVEVHSPRVVDSLESDTNNFCPGQVTALTLTAWGGYGDDLIWRQVVGGDTTALGTGTPLNINAPDTTTTYIVRWETYCGESAWKEITVTVNEPITPAALFADFDTICSDFAGPLTLWGTGGNGDTLRWYQDECNGTTLLTGDTVSIVPPLETTTYFARWENVCGNSDCSAITITVIPAPVIEAGVNDSVCEGSTLELSTATAENYSAISWTSSGVGSFNDSTLLNPIFDPGSQDFEVNDTVYLKMTVFGDAPCGVYTDSIQVVINPKPVLTITPPSPALCRDSVLMIAASGAADYKWIPNESLDTARGAVINTFPQFDKDYQVVGISRSACLDTLNFHVTVKSTPYVNLGEDRYIFGCDPVMLNAGAGDGSENYEWQDGSQSQVYTVTENGTYWVKVFNDGCAKMDTVKIQLCEGYIQIPTAFSPNADGFNDEFKLITTDFDVDFNMTIYDRKGQKVFETDDIDFGWDGTYNGAQCPADVYVFIAKYRGKSQTSPGVHKVETGQVVLIR